MSDCNNGSKQFFFLYEIKRLTLIEAVKFFPMVIGVILCVKIIRYVKLIVWFSGVGVAVFVESLQHGYAQDLLGLGALVQSIHLLEDGHYFFDKIRNLRKIGFCGYYV